MIGGTPLPCPCCNDKVLPDRPLVLHPKPSLRFNSRWRKREKAFAVKITFRKSNKISPVLQQLLKILPFWPNALIATAEDDVCGFVLHTFTSRLLHKWKSNSVKSGECRAKDRSHVGSLALFLNESVTLAVDDNRLAPWIFGFFAGKCISQFFSAVTACLDSGTLLNYVCF